MKGRTHTRTRAPARAHSVRHWIHKTDNHECTVADFQKRPSILSESNVTVPPSGQHKQRQLACGALRRKGTGRDGTPQQRIDNFETRRICHTSDKDGAHIGRSWCGRQVSVGSAPCALEVVFFTRLTGRTQPQRPRKCCCSPSACFDPRPTYVWPTSSARASQVERRGTSSCRPQAASCGVSSLTIHHPKLHPPPHARQICSALPGGWNWNASAQARRPPSTRSAARLYMLTQTFRIERRKI